ncbi:ABC transporter ATP-binding protein [Dongia mobilis]|jgi:peptide/nickel transport system ATP-binding protein|uniref:ABC transporter ATP-binding protein n=1 Tax=Dongia sp. TaxID=1977262 RepID=UPI0026EBF631
MALQKPIGDILLDVRNLSVEFASPQGAVRVIDKLSFDLRAGETLCIAGESGSGKSVTALSLMGLLPKPGGRVAEGSAQFLGRDLLKLDEAAMSRLRGNEISMIFQEPMTSLNPVLSIGTQLTEGLVRHLGLSQADARARALQALDAVRMSEPQRRLKQYPHELSGGMRQRVMIAMAMAARPKILIADEPTTALDVTIQAQILELMATLQRETGTAIIMITHDMGVVAEIADRVVVMRKGEAVERGTTAEIFTHQQHPYTRALLAAVPTFSQGAAAPTAPDLTATAPLITVKDLIVRFDIKGGLLQRVQQRVHAVEKVSFELMPGETLALVGESGCGKSTTGKALMHLVPSIGDIRIEGEAALGQSWGRKSGAELKAIRRRVQMIFQDPLASLDPRMSVGDLVIEPLIIHNIGTPQQRREQAAELFRRVGLTPDQLARFPHEFSGGQRQRICIARALALGPKAIVADECVSALDVSIQAQILELMQELQDELGISYLFISHDMAVVERISHRVAVMSMGQIVETGPTRAVLGNPQHPYTRKLLAAVPIPDPARRHADDWQRNRQRIEGEVPSPFQSVDFTPTYVTYRDLGGGHLVAA